MANYGFTVPQSGYDDGDRLKAWDRADGNKSQSWNLSLVGDWSSQIENGTTTTRTHGPTHTLTAVGSQPVLSDSRGNLTQPGDGRTFSYDLDRMLSSATVTASAPGIEGTHTYTFDALGRRVSKIVAPTGGTSSTLVFIHSGHQIVAEYSPGQVATNPLRKYAFGSYIDEPVALIDHTGAGSGTGTGANNGTTTVYHYHANHLYSVAALTDQSGQVVERYAYDAYGQQLILDGAAATARQTSLYQNRFTYTGREWDAESATYHYRARTYDPRLSQFLQRDAFGYWDSMKLHHYVAGSPLDYTDPSGNDICPCKVGGTGYLHVYDVKTKDWIATYSYPLSGSVGGMEWAEAQEHAQSIAEQSERLGRALAVRGIVEGAVVNGIDAGARTAFDPVDNVCSAVEFCKRPSAVTAAGMLPFVAGGIVNKADNAVDGGKACSKSCPPTKSGSNATSPPVIPPKVPGRVQSRVNISNEGWNHVVERHCPGTNGSPFGITQLQLRELLQSKQVVGTPVSRTLSSADGIRYVREVDLGWSIGLDKFNDYRPTNVMTVLTDEFGNLVTASPGIIK